MAQFLFKLSLILIECGLGYHIIIPKKQGQSAVAKSDRILKLKSQRALTEMERSELSAARFSAWPMYWRNKLIGAGVAIFVINIAILEVKRWLN